MAAEGTVLLEKCPLCGEGPVVEIRQRWFLRKAMSITCPDCDATFTLREGGLELARCEPDKVAQIRGFNDASACRHCYPCLQGVVLSRDEWAMLAEMEWPLTDLPAIRHQDPEQHSALSTQHSALELQEGEEILLDAEPVRMGDEIWGIRSPAGRVIVTNLRLLFLDGDTVHPIPFETIVAVEESQPGLRIRREAGFEPVYLFAPVFSGTLSRIKQVLPDR